ncbi:MAG: PKD domain-containing protein [Bacteroidetes bacterium]|nr:PKD domain-containing protein [Bacteroidota bacterium]
MQEQSQLPSFSDPEVEAAVFPYAKKLDSIINAENPCAETVFYMTWGRKNGDAANCVNWPPVCTYNGMDSLLNKRYRIMADDNNGILSPVGAVWKYIRQNYPLIELYQSDESHPSIAGSYAAACCFYTALFRKDPTLITFNSTLSAADAANIKDAAKLVVFDNLMEWHIGEYDPMANFSYANAGGSQIDFTNNSENASQYLWDFDDGTTSTATNPTHKFLADGTYNVKLLASKCGAQDSVIQPINIATLGTQTQNSNANYFTIYPNPATNEINLKIENPALIGAVYVVYNVSGKPEMTGTINALNQVIKMDNFSNGLYFLQVGEHLKKTFKLLKQ